MRPITAALAICLGAWAPAGAEAPEVNYLLQCQGCHRPDGGGTPGTVPALDGQVARFLPLPGGREYLVRVPGSAQSPLDDAELAELLNWMMRRFGPAAEAEQAAPFSAEEVGPLRVRPLTDVAATRRRLVEHMSGGGEAP